MVLNRDNQHVAGNLSAKVETRKLRVSTLLDGKVRHHFIPANGSWGRNGIEKHPTMKSITADAQGVIHEFFDPCTPAAILHGSDSMPQKHVRSASILSSHGSGRSASLHGSHHALGKRNYLENRNVCRSNCSESIAGRVRSCSATEEPAPLIKDSLGDLFSKAGEDVENQFEHDSPLKKGSESSYHVPEGDSNTGEPSHATKTLIDRETSNHPDHDLVRYLYDTIDRLKHESKRSRTSAESVLPHRWQYLHRVTCRYEEESSAYLDKPQYIHGDQGSSHLLGRLPVLNIDLYIERHPQIAFLVYQDYACDNHEPSKRVKTGSKLDNSSQGIPTPKESIHVVCKVLEAALNDIYNIDLNSSGTGYKTRDTDAEQEISAPYLFVYNGRASQRQRTPCLDKSGRQQIGVFMDFIKANYDAEYDEADTMFANGRISPRFVPFLFTPNTIVVGKEDGQDMAYMAVESPVELDLHPKSPSFKVVHASHASNTESTKVKKQKRQHWSLRAWSWSYDGNFQRTDTELFVNYPESHSESKLIQELNVYPLKYADSILRKRLRERGRKFWECRSRKYVACNSMSSKAEESNVSLRDLSLAALGPIAHNLSE